MKRCHAIIVSIAMTRMEIRDTPLTVKVSKKAMPALVNPTPPYLPPCDHAHAHDPS